MFEFLLFLYFSLSVVFIHILFNMWISHKRINNKSLLQIVSFLLNSERQRQTEFSPQLLSWLVKNIIELKLILYIKQKLCCVVNKHTIYLWSGKEIINSIIGKLLMCTWQLYGGKFKIVTLLIIGNNLVYSSLYMVIM